MPLDAHRSADQAPSTRHSTESLRGHAGLGGLPGYDIQYRTIHGHRRAFVKLGQGPALLLIHGIGNDLTSWGGLLTALASKFTVIAPDLLGHGRSEKPRADYSIAGYANAMRDLLSVLDVDRATIVGHSLGGGVAMQFAYQYPEFCERIVLISPGGVGGNIHPALRLATMPGAEWVLGVLGAPGARIAERMALSLATEMGHDAQDAESLFDVLRSLSDQSSRQAFVRTLRAAVDLRGQAVTMLDRCYLTQAIPTLLVWGTQDPLIPFAHASLLRSAMPDVRFEAFHNAGHFPHRTDAARFVRLLDDFVDTVPAAKYSAERWRQLLRAGRFQQL